jgi:hypothetical protein
MRRDTRESLCVDNQEPPFYFKLVEGIAQLTADEQDLLYWETRIGKRYISLGVGRGLRPTQRRPRLAARPGEAGEDRRAQEHRRLRA